MRRDDYLFYQGRGCAWAIGKGMAPDPIFGDLFGKITGATRGIGAATPPDWSRWHCRTVKS